MTRSRNSKPQSNVGKELELYVEQSSADEKVEVEDEQTGETVALPTPYACHNFVNALLKELGIDKRIPPQMMYRYAADKRFKSERVNGKIAVDRDSFTTWLEGYITRLQDRRARKAA